MPRLIGPDIPYGSHFRKAIHAKYKKSKVDKQQNKKEKVRKSSTQESISSAHLNPEQEAKVLGIIKFWQTSSLTMTSFYKNTCDGSCKSLTEHIQNQCSRDDIKDSIVKKPLRKLTHEDKMRQVNEQMEIENAKLKIKLNAVIKKAIVLMIIGLVIFAIGIFLAAMYFYKKFYLANMKSENPRLEDYDDTMMNTDYSEISETASQLMAFRKQHRRIEQILGPLEMLGPLVIASGILITTCGFVWIPVAKAKIKRQANIIKYGLTERL